MLFSFLDKDLKINLNIFRIILIAILILKYWGYYSVEKIFQFGLLLNLTFLYYCYFFEFDFLALEKGIDFAYVSRFGGFGINPNVEGYLLVLLYMGLAITNKNKLFCFLPFVLIGLFMTFSYTSFFALITFLLIELRKRLLSPYFILISAAIVSVLFFVDLEHFLGDTNIKKLNYLKNFIQTGEGLNNLTTNRFDLFQLGLKFLKSNPITGYGPGFGSNEIFLRRDVGVHNSILEIFIDNGVIFGGLMLIGFLFVIPKRIFLPVFVMAFAGHGFFYDFNFFTIIILILVYENFTGRSIST
jgi:hypothetical protein